MCPTEMRLAGRISEAPAVGAGARENYNKERLSHEDEGFGAQGVHGGGGVGD